MVESPLSTIFGFIGSFYGLVLPLVTVLFVTLLFFVSMTTSGAKPKGVGEAIYCYILHGTSIVLMTVGALPTVFSVFAGIAYDGRTYIALLLIFACGGLLFLMQDQHIKMLDKAPRAIPEAIYMTSLKVIGNLLALLSALSLFLHIVLASFQPGWWVTPFVLLLYGLLLSWCTHDEHDVELIKNLEGNLAPTKQKAKKKATRKRK